MTQTLFNAARDLYQAKGAKMSLSELALKAGVSRATLYQRLGSKADILARLAQDAGQPEAATDIDGRIMQGLLETVATRGFRAATIDDIAAAAGVGPATIYRRYGDKDGLIRSFVASRAPAPDLIGPDASTDTPAQQLAALVRFLVAYMADHRSLVRLVHSGSAEDRAYLRSFREDERSTLARITTFFRAQQASGAIGTTVAPQDLAVNVFGMVFAHTVLSEGRKPFDPVTAGDAILAMFTPLFASGAK